MGVTNRGLESPDETRTFDRGQVQVVKIGEVTIGRYTFEPGWRWSDSVKPIAKTDSCQAHHIGYILSGRLHVVTDDGGEAELGPGEAYEVHPGHDAWVVGDEAVDIPPVKGTARLAARIGSRGHVTFGGRLAEDAEGFFAQKMVQDGNVGVGDFRNFGQIRAWARGVGKEILTIAKAA